MRRQRIYRPTQYVLACSLRAAWVMTAACDTAAEGENSNRLDPNGQVSESHPGQAESSLYLGAEISESGGAGFYQRVMYLTVSDVPTCEDFTPAGPFWRLSFYIPGEYVNGADKIPPNLTLGTYPFYNCDPTQSFSSYIRWSSGKLEVYGSPQKCGYATCNLQETLTLLSGSVTVDRLTFASLEQEDHLIEQPQDVSLTFSTTGFPSFPSLNFPGRLMNTTFSMKGRCEGELLPPAPIIQASPVGISTK